MTRRVVIDHQGDEVYPHHVLPLPDERPHDPANCESCQTGTCWVALIPGYGSCVNGCRAIPVEGGRCIRCMEREHRREEWAG